MADESKKDFNAENLLNEHGKDISGLSERLAKCYSTERYEDFQDAVEKITLKTIDGTGRSKIKDHAKDAAKEYKETGTWLKLTFWLPVIVSVVSLIVAVYVALKV